MIEPSWQRQPKKTDQKAHARRNVVLILGVFAILGWIYVLFFSDAFIINRVEVQGLTHMDATDVSREVFHILDQGNTTWRPWPNRSSWFINTNDLAAKLKDALFAESVMVEKPRFNILRLIVEERANRFILDANNHFFWVDLQGVALQELNPDENADVKNRLSGKTLISAIGTAPIIERDTSDPVASNYHVADADQVHAWIVMASALTKAGIDYRVIQPPSNASTTITTLISMDGYKVLFDSYAPLEPQIDTYNAFLTAAQKGNPSTKVTEYVDVRIPGRVYIK